MKVQPFKIPKHIRERLVVQVDRSKQFYRQLHQHEEIQISYIISGNGKLVIADSVHPFSAGAIFVIGQQCPHVFLSADDSDASHMISIFFTKSSFGSDFFDIPEMEIIQDFFERSHAGFTISKPSEDASSAMLSIGMEDKYSKFITFLTLLRYLSQEEHQVLTGFVYPKNLSLNEGNRMQTVFDFVMNNFQQDIQLATVAEMAFMTPSAFCRFFKLRTNKTFFQFLIELRIEHACFLLANDSSMPISEIATLSGFGSISNFNRKFKEKKGVSPSRYFKDLGIKQTS